MAGSSSNYDWDTHNRQIVLDGRAVLERTSASLARSNQIAIESEETGTAVRFVALTTLQYLSPFITGLI